MSVAAGKAVERGNVLSIRDLEVDFFTARGRAHAVRGLNLDVVRGEILGVVGESGSGKSVTALTVMDLLPPGTGGIISGSIDFGGKDLATVYSSKYRVAGRKGKQKLRIKPFAARRVEKIMGRSRKRISMIFQDPMASLDPLYQVDSQLLESIMYNNEAFMIGKCLEKNIIIDSQSEFTSVLQDKSTADILTWLSGRFGEAGFHREVFFIHNMSISESEKKIKIRRAIDFTKRLSSSERVRLKSRLSSRTGRFFRPNNRKRLPINRIHDPVVREAMLFSLELLEFVGMPNAENVLTSYPHELSGGMKQRVMVALAVANDPEILIADEPTTALDVTTQYQVLYLLKSINRKLGTTIIFITHDLGVMAAMADRIAVMYAGRVVEVGPAGRFFNDPLHPYTSGLLRSVPQYDERVKKLYNIPGQVPDLRRLPTGCAFHPRCDKVMGICSEKLPRATDFRERRVECWLYLEGEDDGDR